MLLRFIAKNIYSFKEETEFNMFPSSKTKNLPHHKIIKNSIEILRFSSIYGANGSGKSNLIKTIRLLKNIILKGKIPEEITDKKFLLDNKKLKEPISLGIEFFTESKIYFYSITFDENIILNEYLVESKKNKDILIFKRNFENNKQKITFFEEYTKTDKNKLFIEILEDKIIEKNQLLLTFLSNKYKNDFKDIENVILWFISKLIIVTPNTNFHAKAHSLDINKNLKKFGDDFISTFNTGISKLKIHKKQLNEQEKENFKEIIQDLKEDGSIKTIGRNYCFVKEENSIILKTLNLIHKNNKNQDISFDIHLESDGTQRLIDYIPIFYDLINQEKIYLIDEIEQSIHPNTIKELISKISGNITAKGQLIFTTHESCLLNQEFLRTDEIWFTQKNHEGNSQLYTLSDFNVHHTANIENGYLNGRYGGIPFISNLHDLNWYQNELSD